ncbi:hypothetical protein [Planktomarina sp.]|uniref:hypothetical protein n=1 Tax=Planktomarina sp. TaxID=2024851 RepID=UPI003260C6A4
MSVKWKRDEKVFNKATKTKSKRVFPIAGVKTSELVELCTKDDSDLRSGERKLRVKARKELTVRGVAL